MVKVDKEVKTEDITTLKYLLQIDEPEIIEGIAKTGARFPDSQNIFRYVYIIFLDVCITNVANTYRYTIKVRATT